MLIETLESRIAPAALTFSTDHKTVTWADVDGDLVTLRISTGTLDEINFTHADAGSGLTVSKLDLTAAKYSGASISIIAHPTAAGGNGSVDFGYLSAAGNALGNVVVQGDLGRLDAGPADLTARHPSALVSLKVASLGARPDLLNGVLPASELHGRVGSITVAGELRGSIEVTGDAYGSIGTLVAGAVTGGDTADTGRVTTTGDLTTVVIVGDIAGGAGQHSGSIEVGGNIRMARVIGSISGGRSAMASTDGTGILRADGNMGVVAIGGSIYGGTQQESGLLQAAGIGTLTIGGGIYGGSAGQDNGGVEADSITNLQLRGDVRGGAADHSGFIAAGALGTFTGNSIMGGAGTHAGEVQVDGTAGRITLRGNIQGGSGPFSGVLHATTLGSLMAQDVVGGGENSGVVEVTGASTAIRLGSILGGGANHSGWLSLGKTGSITLTGDLAGGDLDAGATADIGVSGAIFADRIASLVVQGSVRAGADYNATHQLTDNASIRVQNDLASFTVRGGLVGNEETRVLVTARGEAVPAIGSTRDLAFRTISAGAVSYADVFAGYDQSSDLAVAAVNPSAQIGLVQVTGSWTASNLVAGAAYQKDFGIGTEVKAGGLDNPNIYSRIGAIFIGGAIQGTSASGDHYGFVAQAIGNLVYGSGALAEVKTPPLLIFGPLPSNPYLDLVSTSFRSAHVTLNRSTGNDNDTTSLRYSLANTGDVRVFEFAS